MNMNKRPADDLSLAGIEWAKSESADEALVERALEEISKDDETRTSLSAIIASEILSDGEPEDYRFVDTYRRLDANGKSIIDDMLVSLCGWSMNTLLKKYMEEE